MANIFSGIFNRPQNTAMQLAHYQQQLRDYQDKMDAYQQQQAVQNLDPYIKQVMEEMTPERQAHMMLQRQMMKNPATFEKGLAGFQQSMQQRGTTIADILKQDKTTQETIARHDYKVNNPLPGDEGAKLEYAKAYIGEENYNRLVKEGNYDEIRKLMDRAARARQLIDRGLYWEDAVTGERYDKNVYEEELVRKAGANTAERLDNYNTNRKAMRSMVVGVSDHVDALKRLKDGATNWTTGAGAFLRHLPGTDARDWYAELQTVNSKTVLDTMKELKSLSQSGATGFGAVNEKELMVMMDKWGKLDEFMDDEDIIEVIDRRIKILERVNDHFLRGWKREEKWYRDNRYALPKSARDLLPEETPEDMAITNEVDNAIIEHESKDAPGFTILD